MNKYSVKVILMGSASRDAVDRQARLVGNGWSLPRDATSRTTASRLAPGEPPE